MSNRKRATLALYQLTRVRHNTLMVVGGLLGLCLFLVQPALGQTHQVTGRVTDNSTGDPLIGATVVVKHQAGVGTATDVDGNYRLPEVSPRDTLVFSYVGYISQEIPVENKTVINVGLDVQVFEGNEVVVVGYGVQLKETLTGSVATVAGEDLQKAPAINMANTLTGKLPGVVTINTSGEPGYDGATIRIRGNHTLNDNSPLVVIDGVPGRSGGLERLNPSDIESISVLKDASAAIYGSRAANGVILITTKRGKAGKPQLSLNMNQGFNQPTRIPEMADAVTYLTMLNEIDMYRDRTPRNSQELIDHYANGDDPWLYPNTDWFAETVKPVSFQTKADASLRGGAERMQYYLSLGGLTEDGFYRNSATRYNQYQFRTNIDGQVNDNIALRFDVSGRIEDRNFPNRGAGSIFRSVMRGKPNLPAYWPNGLPGPDIEYGDNPVVIGTRATGYQQDQRFYLQGNLGLDVKIPFVKGLTFRGNAAYDRFFQYNKSWRTPWTLYTWDYKTRDPQTNEPVLTPAKRGYSDPELNQQDDQSVNILLNLVADYKRDFGAHSIGLLAGTERQTWNSSYISAFRKYFISDQIDQIFAGGDKEKNNGGSAGLGARLNYFGRVNYDYQDKYILEFIGRVDGSYIFPKDHRYGFFPAVSAGWRISEEPFFQNLAPVFDNLKIRASVGQTGNDRISEWQYMASYGFGGGNVFGINNEVKSIYQSRQPNPDIYWETANQRDIGIEGSLLKNRLSFEFDYFNYLRTDILAYRDASVPQTAGILLPRENIGKVNSWGYDGSISWRQQFRPDVYLDVTANGGYAQNKINFWDEPPGAPEWQMSTGRKMSTSLYYLTDGVFADQAAVDAYPHWPKARPGDVKFVDYNEDGVIDSKDRVRINKTGDPTFTGGLTFDLTVKNFDFTIFFQGAAGGVQYLQTESGDIGNYFQEFAKNRWTPENPTDKYPRTFNRSDEYWISQGNDYWLRSTDYIRLKTLEVGYRLPTNLAQKAGVQGMRIYVSGFNLLTFDKFIYADPEARSSSAQYYPQKRVLNVGASLTF